MMTSLPTKWPLSRQVRETVQKNWIAVLLLIIIVLLVIVHQFSDLGRFPESWNFGLKGVMDDLNKWVIVSRTSDPVHPLFSMFFNPLSDVIKTMLDSLEDFLIDTPWPVIVTGVFFLTQRITNLRVTLLVTLCVLAMGWLGLWEESMETLALMLFSVVVSLLIGIPLGILSAKNDDVERVLRPILDAMQTMPAFVYLIPVLLFFGIGGVPSMIATVVYAVPPAIRLTSLGIRSISKEAVEAAESFGSTPMQTLFKVEIPMAMPAIITGVNQTIMMALGIVVIASLIGFAGLGDVVLKSLRRLRVGQAFEAGLAIVFLAILLDRVSFALSEIKHVSVVQFRGNRLFPERSWLRSLPFIQTVMHRQIAGIGAGALSVVLWLLWDDMPLLIRMVLLVPVFVVAIHFLADPAERGIDWLYRLGDWISKGVTYILSLVPVPGWQRVAVQYRYWLTVLLLLVILTVICLQVVEIPLPAGSDVAEDDRPVFTLVEFPEVWQYRIRRPIDDAVKWMQRNLYDINDSGIGTGPFSDFLTIQFVIPLRELFQDTIPWMAMMLIFTLGAYLVADWKLALVTFVALFIIGGMGMWEHTMDTLSQVIVAVGLSILIGIPLGIWSAKNDLVQQLLRPVLDFLQTIPAFVYLLPVIMLFSIGRIPGIIASVLYALPPVVRLTNLGIRQVDAAAVEAAESFGSTGWQMLFKVQLPLALPSIMLGINQTIMMVLAMVIIAGLVGGGGLGFEVVDGLSQNEFGQGVTAGLSIVLLAIVLDRITQGYAHQRAKRANLQK